MADTLPPDGPNGRADHSACDHIRELSEFVPLVENPLPYQPKPPPDGTNPYLVLRHVLNELYWLATLARQGHDVRAHINPTTRPWEAAESRARARSTGWGFPFATFDSVITAAKKTSRNLVQVAAGNRSAPFTEAAPRCILLEERLLELANSVPAGDATPADAPPVSAGDYIARQLAGPTGPELMPRDLSFLEAHQEPPSSPAAVQQEQAATGKRDTNPSRDKLLRVHGFNRRSRQIETVDELVSKFYVDLPRGLDPELADAFSAVATGIRECTRLVASVPHLWADEGEYRRLAACVADAATAARTAYLTVDIRLRRAGGPNPVVEALNDVLTVQGRAPVDPNGIPGGLNAILVNLYTKRAELFRRVEGRGCIDRMLDQLARVPPATNTAPAAADPPSAASAPLPTGTLQGEGGKPKPNATTEAILPALLSASDIAARIRRKRESVTSFLTRFAEKHPDCRVENPSKRRNEPGYLYRTGDVWPALEKWMKEHRGGLKHD